MYKSQKEHKSKQRNYTKRNLSASTKNITLHLKKIQKKKINIDEEIEETIKSLDILSVNYRTNNKNPIIFHFPNELKDQEFKELFIKGLKYCKKKFNINNLLNLKAILNKIKEIDIKVGYNNNDYFSFLYSPYNLEKIYKKDILLSLLSDEDMTNVNLKNGIDNVFSTIKEFQMYEQNNIFKDPEEYDTHIQGDLSIKNFELLLYSNTILYTYKEILEELYDKKLTISEIKSALKNFRNYHKIYFISMPKGMFGLTLYDGTILINAEYYCPKIRDPKYTFIIFFTLFHEYTHVLSRLIRGDDNFFINTGKFLENTKKTIKESGYYFEKKILFNFLKCKTISGLEAKYLTDANNYCHESSKDFGKAFLAFKKDNESTIQNLDRVPVARNEENDRVSIRIGCNFAGPRYDTD